MESGRLVLKAFKGIFCAARLTIKAPLDIEAYVLNTSLRSKYGHILLLIGDNSRLLNLD